MVMSQWSATSSYATAGDPPRQAVQAKEPVQGLRAKRKEKPKKAPQPQKAEPSLEEAAQLLKVREIFVSSTEQVSAS